MTPPLGGVKSTQVLEIHLPYTFLILVQQLDDESETMLRGMSKLREGSAIL